MKREKGIGYCGLACAVCNQNETCAGCRSGECANKNWCKNFYCCPKKDLHGCWECDEFPCRDSMLDKLRIRVFARFIKKYGEEKLLNCLDRNEKQGILYHKEGSIEGDYDIPKTEDDITNLILYGKDYKENK